ncbi:MAG: DNA polymerase Y family protein [Streptosporangiales bacterium]|nr:DNA polymerase Y family protein [Streptosporangiales bacterium]
MSAGARPARVLAVWCPDWPVVSVAGRSEREQPVAVVTGGRVVACSAPARAAGVRRGQRLRDAQGRCPQLQVLDDDLAAQVRLFEQVVAGVEQRCPRVEVIRPGLCAVPARGPARYYGGEQVLAELMHETVAAAGVECRVGVADGLFAAVLAARAAESDIRIVQTAETAGFLAGHPVNVLDRPELSGLLVRLGIRTLADFAALPGEDVFARFGADAAVAHQLARGREPRRLAPRTPARDLAVQLTFDPPVEQFEQVVFTAKSLADELHTTLARHGVSCVRVEVEVTTDDGRCWSRAWRHDGLFSASAVAERVRWQLDAWRTATAADEALTGGLVRLRLVPDQLVPDSGRQLALRGGRAADDQVERAATRVQTMLGHAAVTQPVRVGGRGPGDQVLRVPWGDAPADIPRDGGWPGRVPTPAPAVVHVEPPAVAVVDAAGAPVTVDGRCAASAPPHRLVVGPRSAALAVTGWTGPWPAHEYWWDPARSQRSVRCQLVTADGRGWLLVLRQARWYVEAEY